MIKNYKQTQKTIGHSSKNSRPTGDFYSTPSIAVDKLLEVEKFGSIILEPCCGNGAISKVLEKNDYYVISKDLYDWGYGSTGIDFLEDQIIDVNAVITNPPFKLSVEFTKKSLDCTKAKNGKVAILNRLQWLESAKRKPLFDQYLSKVFVFSKRIPRFNRFDYEGKQGTSLLCFAWFIFEHHKTKTILEWI